MDMIIYPHNALDQLNFSQLLDEISELAIGIPAKSAIEKIKPTTSLQMVESSLKRIHFFYAQMQADRYIQLVQYGIPEDLHRCLEIEGYVLSKAAFLSVRNMLENTIEINKYFDLSQQDDEVVSVPFNAIPDLSAFYKSLVDVMDEVGNIKPTASEALLSISKKIQRKQSEISTVFEKFAKQYRNEGLLSEIGESYRNGRRVLALPAENKRRISGIIHGESESGKTVFIEPQGVTEVNNALFQLELDKQKEEYKILQSLSAGLSAVGYDMINAADILVDFDTHYAKAAYGWKRKFEIPRFDPEKSIYLSQAFHPHLESHLREEGKDVVKNDIILHGKNRLLLLSGPNAGGKSVLLKTVAFNQLLFQCGLTVPAEGDSRFRFYKKMALDMGDNQSIEDDLSTYSSHLTHMREMLTMADEETLILIDEFGTGTDPRVGGALAESILHQFVKRGVTAVITTHYSNLKSYAHKMRGIVNGSMSFDMEQLSPTFLVQIGKPGSSFALKLPNEWGCRMM